MKCKYCEKTIVGICNKRSNGKCGSDFNGRALHKKCYKIVNDTITMLEYLKRNESLDVDNKITELKNLLI